jgi:hypothetical protein
VKPRPCFRAQFAKTKVKRDSAIGSSALGSDLFGPGIWWMVAKQIVGRMVVMFDRRFLEGAAHAFDLSVRPGMLRLDQTMIDVVFGSKPPQWHGAKSPANTVLTDNFAHFTTPGNNSSAAPDIKMAIRFRRCASRLKRRQPVGPE